MTIRRVHPAWCAPESGCATSALHLSRLRSVAPRGDEVIQVRAALWQMDIGRLAPAGVLLELSAGDDPERWPVDLAQARRWCAYSVSCCGSRTARRAGWPDPRGGRRRPESRGAFR